MPTLPKFCSIIKQTQTVRSMISISIWEFSNYTASFATQIPLYMHCTSTATRKKGSRPTAVMSLVCGTEYCFFPFSWWSTGWFTKAAFCMQQCPYKTLCALLSAPSESEKERVFKKKKKRLSGQWCHFAPEVKKLNSNLIASSHSLHFHLATVVQKDKGRLCFLAVLKREKNLPLVLKRSFSPVVSRCPTLWMKQRNITSILSIHSSVLQSMENEFN